MVCSANIDFYSGRFLKLPRAISNLMLAGELGFEPRFSESESDVLPLNYSPTFWQPFHIDKVSVLQSRAVGFYKLDRVLFPFGVASTRKLLAIDVLGIAHHHLQRHTQLSGDFLML